MQRNGMWRGARILALLMVVGATIVATASPAQASERDNLTASALPYYDTCGRFWPSLGSFSTERSNGYFRVGWNFTLSTAELSALKCVKDQFGQPYLELDLSLKGFGGTNDWDEYTLRGTNIPGAVHDAGWSDTAAKASPGVTGILVSSLAANTSYYVSIEWNTSASFYVVSGQTPRVSFEWVPSHWANPLNLEEGPACYIGLGLPAWCVFGGGRAFVSGEYYTFFTEQDGIPFHSVLSLPLFFPPSGGGSGGGSGGSASPSTTSGGTPTYDATIRISGTNGVGAKLRSGPYTSAAQVSSIAEGTVVHPTCYTHGENVGGTTLWWKVGNGYYSSFYDTVPLEWQTAIEQHYGIQSCAAIADSDGDGTPDTTDGCPQVHVPANKGCPGKADFNLDGKSDVTAFYRYDGEAVSLWAWSGQSNFYTGEPYIPWTTLNSWQGSRFIPAGTGDFNGDRLQDIAAFYAYDGGGMGLNLWYGNAQGGLSPHQGWYVPNSWEQARLLPAGVGDFNWDGREDIAAFYYYNGNVVNLYVWYGQADLNTSWPAIVWTGNGWDGTRIIPAGVGDVDGDGKLDVSTFYRHDGTMVDQNVWFGDGTGTFTLGRPWHVDSRWDGARFIPMGVADINNDGRADTIAIYRHDGNYVDMRVWYGTTSRIGATDPGGPWSEANWDGSRIIPAGTGDYNGDGKTDIAAFYRHDGQVVGLNIWYGNGAGAMSPFGAWYVDTAWEGPRVIPTAKG